MTTYTITPEPACPYCHGSGTVYDTVDYGSTTAQLESWCNCVEVQIPGDYDDRIDEIEIAPASQPEPEYTILSIQWALERRRGKPDAHLESQYDERYESGE
jgi:hypothetical protein